MSNFLEETRKAIACFNHKPEEITFIGSPTSGHACTWEEFERLADREYYPGYGSARVARDLMILFSNSDRLERAEYDGSEWWRFVPAIMSPPQATKKIRTLFNGDWDEFLHDCNP